MSSTEYPFVIATDFPNEKVNIPRLLEDIRRSPIKTAVDYITASSTACSVWFKAELDSTDEGILYGGASPASDESIIGSHSGAVLLEAGVTKIVNDDQSTVWSQPQTSGGTPISQPNIIPPGYLLYVAGAFDDISGGSRGNGTQMAIQLTDAGSDTVEGRFLEHVYMLGGEMGHDGGKYGDWASMEIYAPASEPEDRTGTGDGNANKSPTGLGFNIIVPAPGNNGNWNVDGSTLENGEINLGLVPVPNADEQGFWHWDPSTDPSIIPVDNPGAPDGNYDLYDASLPIARQANRVSLLCAGDCCPDTVKGKKILPHWQIKFTLSRASSGTVGAAFILKTARLSTT